MLDFEAQRQAMGCDADDERLAVAGALGVDEILTGKLITRVLWCLRMTSDALKCATCKRLEAPTYGSTQCGRCGASPSERQTVRGRGGGEKVVLRLVTPGEDLDDPRPMDYRGGGGLTGLALCRDRRLKTDSMTFKVSQHHSTESVAA